MTKCTAGDCEFSLTLLADDEQEDDVDNTDGTVKINSTLVTHKLKNHRSA